ncbi:hypothetical protein JL721_8420 [Aureococcus anophagefferens]|nr:hypothetical protein JL721_8420 [Aureococcus anophagefferens]
MRRLLLPLCLSRAASFLRARCDVANVTDARFKRVAPQPLQGWAIPDSDVVVGPLPCKTGSTTLRDFVIDRRGGVEIKGLDAFRAGGGGAAFYCPRHPVERFVSGYRQLDVFYKMGWIQKSWFTGACRLTWPEDCAAAGVAMRTGGSRWAKRMAADAADARSPHRALARSVLARICDLVRVDLDCFPAFGGDDDVCAAAAGTAAATDEAIAPTDEAIAPTDASPTTCRDDASLDAYLEAYRYAGSTATNQWTLPPEHKLRRFRDFLVDVERAGRFDALLRGAARANATACHAKVEAYCAAAKVPVREPVVGSVRCALVYFRRGLEEPCDTRLDFVYAGGARSRVEPWALTRADVVAAAADASGPARDAVAAACRLGPPRAS